MRKSIFDLEMRINIDYEYDVLKDILFERDSFFYQGSHYSLYSLLNEEIFPIWKFKGVFVNFDDFCNRLGIDLSRHSCFEEDFLYLLELLINLWYLTEQKLDPEYETYFNKKVLGYMRTNLPLIIEKMNYKIINENDKFRLVKRDSDVDSVLDVVPDNYASLLLDYNDIRNNTIKSKKTILKELDLYLEKNKKAYQEVDKDTYNTIQVIVNKMGVNHPLKEEPFITFNEEKLIGWYDKCFKLIIHLIRKKEIKKINDERKSLVSD